MAPLPLEWWGVIDKRHCKEKKISDIGAFAILSEKSYANGFYRYYWNSVLYGKRVSNGGK